MKKLLILLALLSPALLPLSAAHAAVNEGTPNLIAAEDMKIPGYIEVVGQSFELGMVQPLTILSPAGAVLASTTVNLCCHHLGGDFTVFVQLPAGTCEPYVWVSARYPGDPASYIAEDYKVATPLC